MIGRVVYLVEQPFDIRNYERFGVPTILESGYDVSVFDFTKFRYPRRPSSSMAWNPPVPVVEFDEQGKAIRALGELGPDTFVVAFLGYSPDTFPIFEALSANGIRYAVNAMNALPLPEPQAPAFTRSFRRLLGGWRAAFRFARNVRYRRKSRRIAGATFWMAGGTASPSQYFYPRDERSQILWMHSLDYDIYLRERARLVEPTATAVFLDQYLAFHPDLVVEGKKLVAPDRYYPHLISFFDAVEAHTGLEVEIAAHPRSMGDGGYRRWFGDRNVFWGQTVDLIRRSKLVIAHYSTAVNLAVLFGKPILFVTSAELRRTEGGTQIDAMASWLGRQVVDLDDDPSAVDWPSQMRFDGSAYDRYKGNFISAPEAPELPSWQILADALRRIGRDESNPNLRKERNVELQRTS